MGKMFHYYWKQHEAEGRMLKLMFLFHGSSNKQSFGQPDVLHDIQEIQCFLT